jgi:hypothetical protein
MKPFHVFKGEPISNMAGFSNRVGKLFFGEFYPKGGSAQKTKKLAAFLPNV